MNHALGALVDGKRGTADGMMSTSGYVKIIAGTGDVQSISLDLLAGRKRRLTFGRHRRCDLVLNHPTVSREHFFVEQTGGKLLIVDNSSGNGTFVNGDRISWAELKDGDKIQAGPFVLLAALSCDSESAPGAAGTSDQGRPDSNETGGSGDTRFQGLYPWEYLEGVKYFNAGRYFEAHEIWEDVWLRSGGEEKLFYQMLIQAAVGLHHFERGNWAGARGMHRRVAEKLGALPQVYMSLDLVSFGRQFQTLFNGLIEDGIESPQAQIPRPILDLSGQL